jgi:hypothetical protein
MNNNKSNPLFEVKSHSYQIANTGDYDGYWEITNGIDRIITRADGDEMEDYLRVISSRLNELQSSDNLEFETESENKITNLYLETDGKLLNAKELLNEVVSRHEAGLLPDRFIYEKIKSFLDGK